MSVSIHTFRDWAREDKWTDRRNTFQKNWQEKLQRTMGDALIRRRMRTMERMDGILDQALTKLETNAVLMNSWEGVAGVLIRIIEKMDEFHEKVAGHLIPAVVSGPSQGGGPAPISHEARPRLTDEEARGAALHIIKLRRDKMRTEAKLLEEAKAATVLIPDKVE